MTDIRKEAANIYDSGEYNCSECRENIYYAIQAGIRRGLEIAVEIAGEVSDTYARAKPWQGEYEKLSPSELFCGVVAVSKVENRIRAQLAQGDIKVISEGEECK